MTAETLLIVVLRILLPLTILRWPLAGGIIALLADALDIVLASLVDLGGLWQYHNLDKFLDTYYLGLEAIVAQRWTALPRWTATLLFGFALNGFIGLPAGIIADAFGLRQTIFALGALETVLVAAVLLYSRRIDARADATVP
ncbi:MAG: hypothetical protein IIB88_05920, partial [Chloroflexi bacterium]|nr:hypothetical protein [Chloroflexota bacterium]